MLRHLALALAVVLLPAAGLRDPAAQPGPARSGTGLPQLNAPVISAPLRPESLKVAVIGDFGDGGHTTRIGPSC